MKEKLFPNKLLLTALVSSLTLFENLRGIIYYGSIIDIVKICGYILMVGIIDGINSKNPDTALKKEVIDDIFKASLSEFEDQNPSLTDKVTDDLKNIYNKEYKKSREIIEEKNIGIALAKSGNELVKSSDQFHIKHILDAVERLNAKLQPKDQLQQTTSKINTVISAQMNAMQGTIISQIFLIGRITGKSISDEVKPATREILPLVTDAFIIFSYLYGITSTALNLSDGLINIAIGVCIAMITGIIDTAIENGPSDEKQTQVKLNEMSNMLKNSLQSVGANFSQGINHELEKLEKITSLAEQGKGDLTSFLTEKAATDPDKFEESVAFNALIRHDIPFIDRMAMGIKAATKGAQGTCLAVAYDIGRSVGKLCFPNIELDMSGVSLVTPTITPRSDSHKTNQRTK